MRIRKRFHPSSLSSTAAALSDPQLNRSPVLQPHIRPNSHENLFVVQEDAKTNHAKTTSDPPNPNQPFQQHPTSQEMMIGSANPRWDFLSIHKGEEMNEKQEKVKDDGWKEEQAGKKSSNDTRKESSTGEEMNSGTQLSQPSSSASAPAHASAVIERWCEGDKVVPLKKRKGSFESIIVASKESTNSVKEKMKSKTNKKCLVQNGCDHHGQEGSKETSSEEVKVNNNNNGKNTMSRVKKSKRGSVIMEGSRCSRVNGRGWRCCQQTLVGYSLCEHHLGKGRLRSMSSVRNRGGGGGGTAGNHQIGAREKDDQIAPLSTLPEKQEMINDDDIIDDKKPLMVVTKKRMKLGVVKARSMSSLLGQTNNTALAANGNKHSG